MDARKVEIPASSRRTPPHRSGSGFEAAMSGAAVRVALEVDVPAPVDRVWTSLVDVERWPRWHPGIRMAVLRADAPAPGARLDWQADGMRIRSTVFEVDEGHRIAWSLRTLGAHGAQRWTLEPLPPGPGSPEVTRLRLEEWWVGLTARVLRRTLQRTLDVARAAWLERLRDHASRPD
jgi:uncharacterized protein YndB with AHSA1/START domain